ncbi:MAG: DUF333 domain-containing protein [Nanoarchaeota archaeon]
MKKIIFILLLFVLVVGCVFKSAPLQKAQLANPASVYCQEQGGNLEIRTTADGSQTGYCKFNDGTECEEWAYYRQECPIQAPEKIIASPNPTPTQKLQIPPEIENNCFGFVIGAPDEISLIAQIGGAWARPHPGPFAWGYLEPQKGTFEFTMADDYVRAGQENNVAILGTIWPYADWDQAVCHSKECEVTTEDQFYPRGKGDGMPKLRCVPCSMEGYKTFLTKLVEGYGGDGVEDIPGLKLPIKYWEILNEPEMKDSYLTFYKGTQEEYVQILKASKEAIKSACPDCKIVQGGAAGIDTNMLTYWRKIFELGGADYFDIANIHFINFGDLSTLNVKDFKKLLQEKGISKPLWVTEAEYESESKVERSFTGALNSGASKIFFTRFVVGQKWPPVPGQYSKVYDKVVSKCP